MRRTRTSGLLIAPALLGLAVIVVPLVALLLRVEWGRLPALLGLANAWPALRLSAITTSVSLVLCLLLGTPLAWWLARAEGRWVPPVRAVVTVPVVLPPVVGGVALLMAWGRTGLVGGPVFQAWGVSVPFTPVAVVLSQTFVALPFFVLAVEGAFAALDRELFDVAATMGADDLRTFTLVALPMIGPGLASGAVLAWARALGEFGATITFAGSFVGRTQTAPLAVYVALDQDPAAAMALAVVMLGLSIAVLALLRGRWLR